MSAKQEQINEEQDAFLTTREAAQHLGLCEQTLRRKRITGDGPRYVKLGNGPGARCVYSRAELQAWLAARTFASTSEATVAALARR